MIATIIAAATAVVATAGFVIQVRRNARINKALDGSLKAFDEYASCQNDLNQKLAKEMDRLTTLITLHGVDPDRIAEVQDLFQAVAALSAVVPQLHAMTANLDASVHHVRQSVIPQYEKRISALEAA